MVYISVINTQTLQITFLHDIHIQIRKIQLFIFTEKFSTPGRDLNPGPPLYQGDMLPIELSWLGWRTDLGAALVVLFIPTNPLHKYPIYILVDQNWTKMGFNPSA